MNKKKRQREKMTYSEALKILGFPKGSRPNEKDIIRQFESKFYRQFDFIKKKQRGVKLKKKKMSRMNAVAKKLKAMKDNGVRKVTVFYTREVNGKMVPNYKRIAITAALITAAGAGIYMIRRHKKHGQVLHKKKKKRM